MFIFTFADSYGEAEMVQLLLDSGADKHIETALREIFLDYAKKNQRSESIDDLLA